MLAPQLKVFKLASTRRTVCPPLPLQSRIHPNLPWIQAVQKKCNTGYYVAALDAESRHTVMVLDVSRVASYTHEKTL
jgi:hypothetical protein